MRTGTHFATFWLAASAFLLVADCSNSKPAGCGKETCSQAVWMHIPVTLAASALDQAKVTVCRNGECHDWQLPPPSDCGTAAFPDAPFLYGTLCLNSNQSITLDIQWNIDVPPDGGDIDAGAAPTDGDHYVVTLTTSNGVTSTLLDQSATYHSFMPNGPSCPPVCTQAILSP